MRRPTRVLSLPFEALLLLLLGASARRWLYFSRSNVCKWRRRRNNEGTKKPWLAKEDGVGITAVAGKQILPGNWRGLCFSQIGWKEERRQLTMGGIFHISRVTLNVTKLHRLDEVHTYYYATFARVHL